MTDDIDNIVLDGESGLVVRHIVIAEVIDTDGEETFRWITSKGMADWTALGLVEYTAAAIRTRIHQEDQ